MTSLVIYHGLGGIAQSRECLVIRRGEDGVSVVMIRGEFVI